jgi:hypothetical protein
MPKKEPSKTSGRSTRRGQSAQGKSAPREPARGEAVVGQETATEAPSSAEAGEARPEPFERTGATATLARGQIAERAREIWEQRGRPQGEDEKNWLEAERQLKQERGERTRSVSR